MAEATERGIRIPFRIALACLLVGLGAAAVYGLIYPVSFAPLRWNAASVWLTTHLPASGYNGLVRAFWWVKQAGLLLACGVSLVAGLRHWRSGARGWRTFVLVGAGLLLGLVLTAIPPTFYWYTRGRLEATRERSREVNEKIGVKLRSGDLPPESRDRLWALYAQNAFVATGTRVELPDGQGGTTPYEPTANDLKTREFEVRMWERYPPPWRATAQLLLFVLGCAALGALTPIRPPQAAPPVVRP